jgi:uncharacterized membrane protein
MLYPYLKWLHVLSAIVAVGANATYGVWLSRAAKHPEDLPFVLKTIKVIDDRMANPAYGLLLITGLWMALIAPLPLTTPWLLTALVLYVILVLLGLFGYTPVLRLQIRLLEAEGFDSPAYRGQARLGMIFGMLLAILAITIVFLMVVKPPLWA